MVGYLAILQSFMYLFCHHLRIWFSHSVADNHDAEVTKSEIKDAQNLSVSIFQQINIERSL